jgi:hypothetical protein
MPEVLAIELKYHDGSSEKTRYITDEKAFVTKPSDTPANIAFLDRMAGRSGYTVDAIQYGTTFGVSQSAAGQLELVNVDGGLDSWANDGVSGREIIIRKGQDTAAYPNGFSTIFRGVQAALEVSYKRATITFADRQVTLQKPLQTNFYAGNNSLPNGLEGVAELKGKPKQRVYGRCKKVPLQIVNTSRLIYLVSDQQAAVSAVYDGGGALTAGAAYASQADMETTAPAAGNYRVWQPAGAPAYVRLGSSPARAITADVDAAGTAANWTTAQVLKAIAIDAGFAPADVNAADVAALDTANNAVVGYALLEEDSALDAMNAVAAGVGAVFWIDTLNALRMFRLVAPTGLPVTTLTTAQMVDIERIATGDRGLGIPTYRVELDYQRYWKTQSNTETVGAVEAARPDLAQAYRRVTSEDLSIQTKHTNAPVMRFQTLLDASSAAQAEADRRLTLYKADRVMLKVKINVPAATLALLVLGAVVNVTINRFGLGAGKLFVVLGITVSLRENTAELVLWG